MHSCSTIERLWRGKRAPARQAGPACRPLRMTLPRLCGPAIQPCAGVDRAAGEPEAPSHLIGRPADGPRSWVPPRRPALGGPPSRPPTAAARARDGAILPRPAPCRLGQMRALTAAVLGALVACAAGQPDSAACDDACREQQSAALLALYSATNGPSWSVPTALTIRGRGGTVWGTPDAASDSSLPAFCGWQGARLAAGSHPAWLPAAWANYCPAAAFMRPAAVSRPAPRRARQPCP